MLKIILCDDDSFTLSLLSELVRKQAARLGISAEIACRASSAGELISFINTNPGEYLFLLDMELGGSELNGLDLARLIREKSRGARIAFVTSHGEKSMAVLKSGIEPFDFIEKQLDLSRTADELARCLSLCAERDEAKEPERERKISLQAGLDEYVDLPVERISYVETVKSAPHNICYHTVDGSAISVRDTIAHAQKLLGEDFALCHRSVLVNRNCVLGLSGSELVLSSGERVECAVSRKSYFVKKGK